MNWHQIRGMIRYELVMSWRRGSLRTIVVMTLLLPILGGILIPINAQLSQINESLWPGDAQLVHTGAAIGMTVFVIALTSFILPLMLSEVIPLDRQYEMDELLNTLPLSVTDYVMGKVLGFWGVLCVLLPVMALLGGWWVARRYPSVDAGLLTIYWLTGPILLSLFSAQMGIMLAARRSSRKQALISGLVAGILSTIAMFILPIGEFIWTGFLATNLGLLVPGQLSDVFSYPQVFSPAYLLRIGLVIAVMAGVWWVTNKRLQAQKEHMA